MENIIILFSHYGYIALLVGLMIEFIGFPTPGEIMMSYCGLLIFQGKMNYLLSILAASTGACIGITISYVIGYLLGNPFFYKYGKYIHLGPQRLNKTSKWFEKYGRVLIVFAYFIPGIRHITGYFSGISRIYYKKFMLYAYGGIVLWTTTFISLGRALGPKWDKFHSLMARYGVRIGIILFILLVFYCVIRYYKNQIISKTIELLNNSLQVFHSLGRMKFATSLVAIIFLGLSAYMIGLIQDFLGNEFTQFDTVATFIIRSVYSLKWKATMSLFANSTSSIAIFIVFIISVLWISLKGTNKLLEIRFLLFSVAGGEIVVLVLQNIFRRNGPLGINPLGFIKYSFPSSEALISVILYGYLTYTIVRHSKNIWLKAFAGIASVIICLFTGQSVIYFQMQYPSDVVAGYTFGGVWLSLSIVMLEIYRILPLLKNKSYVYKKGAV